MWTSGPDSMYKYVEADLALLGWVDGSSSAEGVEQEVGKVGDGPWLMKEVC